MKLSLQLKLGQQLTMTPQLQQAIRLLQLSTLDLQQEIHQALESNPMLELIEHSDEENQSSLKDPDIPFNENLDSVNTIKSSEERSPQEENFSWDDQIPAELAVDSSWNDVYPDTYSARNSYNLDSSDYESRSTSQETLQDHLLWQLNLTPMSEKDQSIALIIIDAIDSNGALTIDIESIHAGADPELEIEPDEIVAVLHRIQQFDPIGVGYRDLIECLLIQLNQYENPTQRDPINNAKKVIKDHITLLGKKDYIQIMRKTKLSEAELKDAIEIIENLDPRPGANISPPSTTYIAPDIIVTKHSDLGKWKVELNLETTPKIRINDDNASLVKKAASNEDNNYLKNNLQEARWFIKSLQSRNETLLKVATRIVEHQEEFLEHGEEAMKPLVLQNIAEAVDMHESTISRVTTQKYMHTPRGIFELKYFFSSHVSTKGGGECSSTAIRAIIKKLIAAENTTKPLSDKKITDLLEKKGIVVARRTIAKYRESLSIPPSNERKRLAG
jgi:RNA polymerase sigma-54 factor